MGVRLEAEGRGQMTDVRCQTPEGRGQRAVDRGQGTEGSGQRTEDRGLKTGDRGQRTEDGGQRRLNSEFGMRPPARRGHRGLRPGGNAECECTAMG